MAVSRTINMAPESSSDAKRRRYRKVKSVLWRGESRMLVYPASKRYTQCYLNMAGEEEMPEEALCCNVKAERPKLDHKGGVLVRVCMSKEAQAAIRTVSGGENRVERRGLQLFTNAGVCS